MSMEAQDFINRSAQSKCCGAPIMQGNMCSNCQEHCEPEQATEGEQSPTPRTDEIRDRFRGQETMLCRALIAHANTLERELNEAKAAIATWRDLAHKGHERWQADLDGDHRTIVTLRQTVARLTQERDEARRDRSTMETRHGELVAELAELRKDRERYEYIRKGCTLWQLSTGQWELTTKEGEFIGLDLDTLIDAASNQQENRE